MAKQQHLSSFLILIGAMASTSCFMGCYTQLYSRGYAERAAANVPEYSRAPQAPADTLTPDSAAGEGRGAGTVIVNHYYQESPYYRGHLIQDWNYPTLTFGIYSSRYRDYYGPFWWNDPWYRTGGGYHRGYHGDNGGYRPPSGVGTGPYTSDKRIFTALPDRDTRKGRRSDPILFTPAPKYAAEPGSSTGSGGSSGSSSGSSSSASSSSESTSGSSSGSSSESSGSRSASSQKSSEKDNHPSVNKGKRR